MKGSIVKEELFKAAMHGLQEKVSEIIEEHSVACSIDKEGFNLFEYSAYFGQLEMMEFCRELLGVESQDDLLLSRAATLGRVDILEYLHKELGIRSKNKQSLIKKALEPSSLCVLKFIRFQMNIKHIRCSKVFELALAKSVANNSLEILRFMNENMCYDFSPREVVPYDPNNSKRSVSLYRSFKKALKNNFQDLFRYAYYVCKLDFSTEDPSSQWGHYLKLLSLAVEQNNLEMLDLLVNELQIKIKLLPEITGESLALTIIKSQTDENTTRQMLALVLPHETPENVEAAKLQFGKENCKLFKQWVNNGISKKPKLGLWRSRAGSSPVLSGL